MLTINANAQDLNVDFVPASRGIGSDAIMLRIDSPTDGTCGGYIAIRGTPEELRALVDMIANTVYATH